MKFVLVVFLGVIVGSSVAQTSAEFETDFDQLVNITILAKTLEVSNEIVLGIRASVNPYQDYYLKVQNTTAVKFKLLENLGTALTIKYSQLFMNCYNGLENAFAEKALKSEYDSLLTSCFLPMVSSLNREKNQIKSTLTNYTACLKCWKEYKENIEENVSFFAENFSMKNKALTEFNETIKSQMALYFSLFDKFKAAILAECADKRPKCFADYVSFDMIETSIE
jgi:hypothetical protein